jgi:hypothetical protein
MRDAEQLRQVRLQNNHPAPFQMRTVSSPRQSSLKPAHGHLRVRGEAGRVSNWTIPGWIPNTTSQLQSALQLGFRSSLNCGQSRAGSKRGRPRRLPKPTTAGGGVGPERNRLSFKPSPDWPRSAFKPGSPTRPPSAAASPGRGRTGPVRNSTPVSNPLSSRSGSQYS